MRTSSDMPRPRPDKKRRFSRRARITLVLAIVALLVLIFSLRGIAGIYTDYLWFDSLDLSSVWSEILITRILLALVFIGAFFAFMWTNLYIADRLAPEFRPPGPEEDLLGRYHTAVGKRAGLIRIGVSLLFAIIAGAGASGQWQNWIFFRHGVSFGVDDPQFDRDIGFYIFDLPFIQYMIGWAFAAVIIIFIVTAVAHYVNGGIRVQTQGQRVTPQVKAHLSVLLGILALIKAADYWYDRFGLVLSTNGTVDGATFTDVRARLPVLNLLLLISLLAFGLLIWNIRRRGWTLPVVAVGLWAIVAIVMGSIYPAFIQRFRVEPSESTKEAEFIDRNIVATREGLGLSDVVVQPFRPDDELTAEELEANEDIVRNIRLLDPKVVPQTFEQLQAERDFYRFTDPLDTDRYMIDGELTQVVLAARELNPSDLPQTSWEGRRLGFTHGFGLTLAAANEDGLDREGQPNFLIQGIPVVNGLDVNLDQPRIYVGEDLSGYSIVNAGRAEVDFVDDSNQNVFYNYEGDGGVQMDGIFRRAAFALRFGDINPLISGFVNDDSRIIYVRDVQERVEKIAPFLDYDADVYPVIAQGRINYIIDAYTTSDQYPYAQRANVEQIDRDSGLRKGFNYVRNSVKVVVDGFNGNVDFYIIDENDPLIQAYAAAFPELFKSFDEMPEDLQEHIRYPEDLFRVQTNMWSRYHLSESSSFYEQAGGWSVAQDPGGVDGPASFLVPTGDATAPTREREERIAPYYMLMQLPGEDDMDFVILRSFVPFSESDDRRELTAFMTAKSDPDEYGQITVFEVPGTQVAGPAIIAANILQNEEISQRITLLDQQGSEVSFGDLLLVPVEDTILYVRPLYVQASTSTAVPELKNVIVAFGNQVVMEPTLDLALDALFGPDGIAVADEPQDEEEAAEEDGVIEPTPTPEETAEPEPTPSGEIPVEIATIQEIQDRLEEISALFDALQQDLSDLESQVEASETDAGTEVEPEPTPTQDPDPA